MCVCVMMCMIKVEVAELRGKTVALYFAASRSAACQEFTERLIHVYNQLREDGADFEVLFISDDEEDTEFQSSLKKMPWPALPYSEREIESLLSIHFDVKWIPWLVVIGTDGRSVLSVNGHSLVIQYGKLAYPFTKEHIDVLGERQERRLRRMPEVVELPSHEHKLVLREDEDEAGWGLYVCSVCNTQGSGWVYSCPDIECHFKVHPSCVDPEFKMEDERLITEEIEVFDDLIRERKKLTNELVENEAKKVLVSGIASAIVAIAIGICTACCTNSTG